MKKISAAAGRRTWKNRQRRIWRTGAAANARFFTRGRKKKAFALAGRRFCCGRRTDARRDTDDVWARMADGQNASPRFLIDSATDGRTERVWYFVSPAERERRTSAVRGQIQTARRSGVHGKTSEVRRRTGGQQSGTAKGRGRFLYDRRARRYSDKAAHREKRDEFL